MSLLCSDMNIRGGNKFTYFQNKRTKEKQDSDGETKGGERIYLRAVSVRVQWTCCKCSLPDFHEARPGPLSLSPPLSTSLSLPLLNSLAFR